MSLDSPGTVMPPQFSATVSPCVGTCKLDEATGYCIGCARTGDEIGAWRGGSDAWRGAVWEALPERFAALGVACRRLPWESGEIREYVAQSLREKRGTWLTGVVGAVAEFVAAPGAEVKVSLTGTVLEAVTEGGRLHFALDDHIRALTFDPPGTPAHEQRVVLAAKRERGRLPVSGVVADCGPDAGAVTPAHRHERLYDLGLGRKEGRFGVRVGPGPARDALEAAKGRGFGEVMGSLGPALLAEGPPRVVESALGRIEVLTPIPVPGGPHAFGPHTHLMPDHLATGRAMPAGMDLPRAYLPGAIFYPKV